MTKLDKIKEAFKSKDFNKAISIASKFPRLGKEKDAIKLAQDCIINPSFYRQLGYSIEDKIKEGIDAIAKKYEIA